MNEQERADWLARAVDEILNQRQTPPTPPELDDQELKSLLDVARSRAQFGRAAAETGIQYEGLVWRRVLERLHSRENQTAIPEDSIAEDLHGMESVIRLRKRFSQQLFDFSDTRRDAVWDTVESRVQEPVGKASIFRWLSSLRANRATVPSLEGLPVAQTAWYATGASSQQVIEAARRRRALARIHQDASVHSESRVWGLVRSRLTARNAEPAGEARSPAGWPRLALAGAAVALLIAAVGPLPSAGLAHHPAIGLVDFIGETAGISTESAPPTAVPPADVLQGVPATAKEASEVLGLWLSEPSAMDQRGYQQASSMLFARGVTAADSGVFVLTYSSPDGTVTILQEAAGSTVMNAPEGAARTVTLADGAPAVLIDGGWDQGTAGLQRAADGQQLVFERRGVRTIIIENGRSGDASLLSEIADSMAPASQE